MVRVADFIIELLAACGVHHIFTVTGRGTLYLTDALAKCPDMDAVCVHNEQAGAYAAVAYAKSRDSLGACLLTTGCGSTNAISGALCAWQDETPCVFISGQNMLRETVSYANAQFRTFGSQEADIISLVSPITKYAVMLTEPGRAVYEIEKAFYMAQEGKKGPVWIDIPLDIQNARIEPEQLEHFKPESPAGGGLEYGLSGEIDVISRALDKAKRPVILIGNGVRQAKATDQLEQLIERISVPVTYAHTASDIYGLEHDLSIGCVGSLCGTRAGNFAVQNADLLLVLGCRLTSMTTGDQPDKFARAASIIVVDIDKKEHTKNTCHIHHIVEADVGQVLELLLQRTLSPAPKEWVQKCLHWKQIFPKCEAQYRQSDRVDLHYLAEVLSEKIKDDTRLVVDAGLEELLLPANMTFGRGTRCIQPAMQGAMGFALPGAIGAVFAGEHPVVAVIGDGSVMMNLQELQTIHYYKLPIKIIVTNNNAYAVIRQRQRELFRTRTIGTDDTNGLECADFQKVAQAFDLPYVRIEGTSELEQGLARVLAMEGAVLCEILCVEDQKYLRTVYARTQNHKFVQRPLEDQEPFLDREIFLKEMVIDPIDQ